MSRNPYTRGSSAVVVVAGALAIALGLAVLWGWHTGATWLIQIRPDLPPMPYASAVAFMLCGTALLALLAGWRRVTFTAAGLAAALGLLSLARHTFKVEPGIDQFLVRQVAPRTALPSRIPPNGALCLLLAGGSLALLGRWPRRRGASAAAAVSGSVVVGLGLIALAGYLIGLPIYGWWPLMTRMAAAGTVGFTALGAGLVAWAWREEQAAARGWPRWLPLPVGLCALTVILCLWQAVEAYEANHLAEVARLTAVMADEAGELAARDQLLRGHTWVLPEVTVAAGMALTVLLTLAVYLAQVGHRRARWAEQAYAATQAETQARRQAEQDLDQFFALSVDMLAITGLDGYFKRINPAFERILGYPAEELLARPFMDFIHPEDCKATAREMERLAEGRTTLLFENRYRAADGTYRWFRWSAVPDLGRQLLYCVARDVTELKRAEEELRRAHDELEERVRERTAELESFNYSVSHDLRAPLRHIDGFSKLLLEQAGAQLTAESRRWLERIREGAVQMGCMVDDLLSFSRMGRVEPRWQHTDMRALVEEAWRELRPERAGREVDLRLGTLPSAECDPPLLKQVFVNLLSNALKFTRPRPRAIIEVGSRIENAGQVFFVRDNGVGFDMKYADKLFGVFQRLHRREEFDGTGVGLATVQRIIHKHGGVIWAEAEPDRGATLFFTLGAGASQAQERRAAAAAGN